MAESRDSKYDKGKTTKGLKWPVDTNGCESWTMRKYDETKIRAFEMTCLRYLGYYVCHGHRKEQMNGGNRKTAAGVDKKAGTNIFRTYDEEERRKPGERNYTGEHMPGGRARGRPKMR